VVNCSKNVAGEWIYNADLGRWSVWADPGDDDRAFLVFNVNGMTLKCVANRSVVRAQLLTSVFVVWDRTSDVQFVCLRNNCLYSCPVHLHFSVNVWESSDF
jgi:hypothetical protein